MQGQAELYLLDDAIAKPEELTAHGGPELLIVVLEVLRDVRAEIAAAAALAWN